MWTIRYLSYFSGRGFSQDRMMQGLNSNDRPLFFDTVEAAKAYVEKLGFSFVVATSPLVAIEK